jgi:hypothetical protein
MEADDDQSRQKEEMEILQARDPSSTVLGTNISINI